MGTVEAPRRPLLGYKKQLPEGRVETESWKIVRVGQLQVRNHG